MKPSERIIVSATEPTTNEKVWIQKGKNLFDGTKISGQLTDSGGTDTNSDWFASNFIPVKENTKYTLSFNATGEQQWVAHYYTKNNTDIGSSEWGNVNGNATIEITTPSNCFYVRFGLRADLNHSNVQFEQGDKTEYEAYVEKKIWCKNDNGVYEEFYKENKGKILWTNPNPTASIGYSGKGITLLSEDYDELEFWCFYDTTNKQLTCTKTKKGYNASITNVDGYRGNLYNRSFVYVSKQEYTINSCFAYGKDYTTPPIETKGYLIPVFVIGYKN